MFLIASRWQLLLVVNVWHSQLIECTLCCFYNSILILMFMFISSINVRQTCWIVFKIFFFFVDDWDQQQVVPSNNYRISIRSVTSCIKSKNYSCQKLVEVRIIYGNRNEKLIIIKILSDFLLEIQQRCAVYVTAWQWADWPSTPVKDWHFAMVSSIKLIRIYEKWFCFFFQMLDDVVLRVLVLFVVYQNN